MRRGCGCALVILVGIGVILAAGWWWSRSEPSEWKKQDALSRTRTESERRELAQRAERRLRDAARQVTRGAGAVPPPSAPSPDPSLGSPEGLESSGPDRDRPREPSLRGAPPSPSPGREPAEPSRDEARQVTLTLDELNALLQERVARWEAQRKGSPLPVRNPILTIEGDHLVLFVQLLNRGSEMLLGLPVDVTIDDRGGVARLLGVRLGQLPLPGLGALPRLLRSTGDPGLAELAEEAEAAANGYPFDPTLEVDGDTPLSIVGLEVDGVEQAVHLTVAPGG